MDSPRLSNRMDPTAVSGRIKSARIALGLSQGVLASRLGVHRRLESRMLMLSRHVPVSFLATVIALLESASAYLE